MPQETNRLHKWTAITAAIMLCLNALIDLYNHNYFQHPSFSNPWYNCTILIPIALNLIHAFFLFRRKTDIATGCVFVFQIIYPILIAPLFYFLWMETDHVIVQSDSSSWLGMLLTLIGSAYILLMALDCLLSFKQALHNARIAFLILPVFSVVCNIIRTIASYKEAGITLDAPTILSLMVGFVISYSPTILTGLSFFLSYGRASVPTEPEQL